MLAMVVDDDPLVRLIAGRALRRAGIGCLGFRDADEAMSALGELRSEVAVLVTDVSMPGSVDGLGLVRHVESAHPGLRVIVMSGSEGSLACAAAMSAVSAVIAKPFTPGQLTALVRGVTTPGTTLETP